jgi:ACS family glucarate transporter-like MFS transporter
MVTYIDRVNISVTARQMMPAYGLTDQDMGMVFSSFVIGYALFQIPGGWLADRWGVRVILTLALIWWSLCTALTAIAATTSLVTLFGLVGVLALVRGSLGIGEAVALPSFNRAVANWLPADSRGLGIGIAIGGIGLGSAITPPLAAWIMVNWGWQTVFYLASLLGLGMALLWFTLSRNHPHEHPWTNEAERTLITQVATPGPASAVPWALFARTPTIWWLVSSYTCLGYVAYIYMSWFYLYLVNVRGFDLLRGGFYGAAPFVAMLVFCPLGGWTTDQLAARYGVTTGRGLLLLVFHWAQVGCTLLSAPIGLRRLTCPKHMLARYRAS